MGRRIANESLLLTLSLLFWLFKSQHVNHRNEICQCRNVNVCPWRLHQPALDTTMASMQMELQVETTTLWSCELLKHTAVTWIFQLAFFAASGATFLCNK